VDGLAIQFMTTTIYYKPTPTATPKNPPDERPKSRVLAGFSDAGHFRELVCLMGKTPGIAFSLN